MFCEENTVVFESYINNDIYTIKFEFKVYSSFTLFNSLIIEHTPFLRKISRILLSTNSKYLFLHFISKSHR